jgi:fused signal recognition particle receptor
MIMHLSGLVAAHDRKSGGCGDRRVGLDVERAVRSHARSGRGQQRFPLRIGERGIEEDDVEQPRFARQKHSRVGAVRLQRCRAEHLRGRVQGAHQLRLAVDGDRERGTARECLERKRPAPGKRIERAGAIEILAEPVEQCFANPVGSRTNVGHGGKADASPAPAPADDANLLGLRQTCVMRGKVELYLCLQRPSPMLDLFKRKPDEGERSWSERLKSGLGLSRERISRPLTALFGREALSEEAIDELRSALLGADVGIPATEHLLDELVARWKRADVDARAVLKSALAELLAPLEQPLTIGSARPFVIMLAGVNGAGKTTSIGKLAKYLQNQGHSVLLAAGDTFRAAAREQLEAWGARNHVQVVAQHGGDPAAVMFDAISAARARRIDVVLADTAGRLPTQLPLMDELKKIRRVIAKAQEGAPHETLLVLDANTGQNALAQVAAFDAALGLTGLVLTKLDGTAKGGVVAAIAKTRPIPLKMIGVGEGIDDLRPFHAAEFADALIG